MNKSLWFSTAALPLIFSLLILAGCGQDQSSRDDIPPSTPQWVRHSADDSYPQEGIRAEPVTDARNHWVRLEWYANPEPDVVTYRVWRISETDPNPLHHNVIKDLRVGVDPGMDEGLTRYSWVDQGFNPDDGSYNNLDPDPGTGQSRGFYWELQAIDSAGNRSPLSTRVYYRLLANPYNLSVTRDSSDLYTLSYQFTPNSNDDVPIYDFVRVYSRFYGPDSVVWYQKVLRYTEAETVPMDFRQSAAPPVLDCTYVCQVNVICNRRNEAHTDSLAGGAGFTVFRYQH